MSWYTSACEFAGRVGGPAKFVAKHVLSAACPGGSIVAEVVERVLEGAQDASKSEAEKQDRLRQIATQEELERVGAVLDEMTGRLGDLVGHVAEMDGIPAAADRLIRKAFATEEAVQAGFANLAGIADQFDFLKRQNQEVLDQLGYAADQAAAMGQVLDRQTVWVEYAEELRAAGVSPQQFAGVFVAFVDCMNQARAGQAVEALPRMQELADARPDSPALQEALAVTAVLAAEPRVADRALVRAARLKPNDRRLAELSRRVTVASQTPLETPRRRPVRPAGLKVGDTLDGWRLLRLLGAGGWGQVFLADRGGQTRALKVIHADLAGDPDFVVRFQREAGVLQLLRGHPNLVAVDRLGRDLATGAWFLLMEYVQGESLQTRLMKGALPVAEAVRLVRLAGLGLGKAHEAGVVHRDVKPANLLIQSDGTPKLIDFGVALPLYGRLTGVGEQSGCTVTFASPEQLRLRPATERSDVYSLAGTLYYAITLREPHDFDPATIPGVPGARPLALLLKQALETPAHLRPANAAEFARLLDEATAQPIPVVPVVGAVTPTPGGDLSSTRRSKQEERQRVHAEARRLQREGRYADALACLETLVPAERRDQDLEHELRSQKEAVERLLPPIEQLVEDDLLKRWHRPQVEELCRLLPKALRPDLHELLDQQDLKPLQPGDIMTNRLGMKLAWVPPGHFLMGEPGSTGDDRQHKVTFKRGFFLGVGPVTRGQFARFVQAANYRTEAEQSGGAYGLNGSKWEQNIKFNWRTPGFAQTDDHPVVCVSWNDARAFCKWLKEVEQAGYGLPTEPMWEYACRADTTTQYHYGASLTPQQANFGNAHGGTTPVGSFRSPNKWGLHDMQGNVWEWCSDCYGPYPPGESTDPQIVENSDNSRVQRGGSWGYDALSCRAFRRGGDGASRRYSNGGFRVALRLD
jgi:formylglycine-generating enzyme required for sulfatase activity/predicted Ser/Thr protein kinase